MPIYQRKLERIPGRLHRPEAYWRSQLRLPSPYRDTRGMLADLCRRLLTRIVTVRWRLTVRFTVEADIDAADPACAAAELEAAVYRPGTLITLLRSDPGATPPWRPIGMTRRPLAYMDCGAHAAAHPTADSAADSAAGSSATGEPVRVWHCTADVVVAFTVDVAEASWPGERYAVGVPADRHVVRHSGCR